MIYRGIKIKKIENMNYEFKFGDTIHASRIATVRAIIDGLTNCKDSTELVSVCEFQLSTKTVFDWGEKIRLKLVPILIDYLCGKADFILVERKRSNSTRKLINKYFEKGFVCLN
nr:MAG TPA: hypothetical protein [Bacteriophage sp.]